MKKLAGVLIVGAVVAALTWLAFRPQVQPVDVGQVERGELEVSVSHEGKTRAVDLYEVRAPLGGTLRRIRLDPGDPLVAGETLLAEIDPLEPELLDERAVAQAEARLSAGEAALEQAQRLEERAEGQLALARQEYQRQEALAQSGVESARTLEAAERELLLWESALKSSLAAVKVAQFELAVAKAALFRTKPGASEGGGERSLRMVSPIDGRVFRILRESRGPVRIGDPLLQLGDPRRIEVIADFLSTEAVKIRPGMTGWVEGWGGGRALRARVRVVEPSGFAKVSALGVEEQRVNVVLDLVDSSAESAPLGDGFRVEVRVVLWRQQDIPLLPEGSLFRHGEGWAVFAIEAGRARLRGVTLGRRNGRFAELLDGLQEGAEVVMHPTSSIAEGVLVEGR